MDLILVREFMNRIVSLDRKEFMMNMITFNISPTIKGVKPSTLITLSNNNRSLYESWLEYGEEYKKSLNIECFELAHSNETIILLFYNKDSLSKYLNYKDNRLFLQNIGYDSLMTLEEKLNFLKERYSLYKCPHEIGIFLGIPVEDVLGFLKCNGRDCLACGYWKVYDNKSEALRTFEQYNKCKSNFAKLYLEGVDLLSSIRHIGHGEISNKSVC